MQSRPCCRDGPRNLCTSLVAPNTHLHTPVRVCVFLVLVFSPSQAIIRNLLAVECTQHGCDALVRNYITATVAAHGVFALPEKETRTPKHTHAHTHTHIVAGYADAGARAYVSSSMFHMRSSPPPTSSVARICNDGLPCSVRLWGRGGRGRNARLL